MKKCIYCKATANPGYSCSKSPTKYHCIPLLKKCAYCSGGLNPGYPCTKSPTKYHAIIYPGKCTYCGSSSKSGIYSKNPSKKHIQGSL